MKRLILAFAAVTATALMLAGCSDAKDESSNEEKALSETSQSEVTSESAAQETESETTSKTTKKSTSSTPIPTQATLRTTPRTSLTTTVTTTTTTTTTEQIQTETQPPTTKFSMTEGAYSVLINGKRAALGMNITDRINEFGALQATVSQVGDISIYSYEGCKITAQSGYIKQISIIGESVSTDTGITIGSSREEVMSKYGNAAYSKSFIYASSGASTVQFNIENDLVTMITLSVS